jgi:serine phosphatase RsbU (regulator of sigma subunit)
MRRHEMTEATDAQGRLWGTADIAALLEASAPEQRKWVLDGILERMTQFLGDRSQEDDVTAALAVFAQDPSKSG